MINKVLADLIVNKYEDMELRQSRIPEEQEDIYLTVIKKVLSSSIYFTTKEPSFSALPFNGMFMRLSAKDLDEFCKTNDLIADFLCGGL
jgi:hypothetical protein